MRRFIPVALVLVLVLTCALPVAADDSLSSDYNDTYWIDIMDYSFVFSDSNTKTLPSGQISTIKLPMFGLIRSLDIVVYCPRSDCQLYYIPPYTESGVELNRQIIDGGKNLYRFYGDVPDWNGYSFGLKFEYSGSPASIEFFQLKYSSVSTNSYTSTLNGTFTCHADAYSTIKDPSTTTPAYAHIPPLAAEVNDYFWNLTCLDWRKYDMLDIRLTMDVLTIESITAKFGNTNLPLEVSYLEGSAFETERLVSILVDLRGLDRSVQNNPYIAIYGDCNISTMSYIQITWSTGLVVIDNPSVDVYLHNHMQYFLDSKINSVIAAISPPADTSVGDELVSQGQQIQNYEQSHQNVLQSGVTTLQKSANIGKFSTALAFVGNYTTSIFNAMGDFQVVYTLPLTIGLILFLSSRVRGNDKPRKNNDKPKDGTQKGGTTSGNDSVTYTNYY